jgi:hypothetical protein
LQIEDFRLILKFGFDLNFNAIKNAHFRAFLVYPALILPPNLKIFFQVQINLVELSRRPAPNRGFVGEGVATNLFAKFSAGLFPTHKIFAGSKKRKKGGKRCLWRSAD